MKHRGVYERKPGSGIWWTRWTDQHGKLHREQVGSWKAACALYNRRKTQALERRKLPELHKRAVTFGEIAQDTLAYSRQHHRNKRNAPALMRRFLIWWKDRPAESLTPAEIEHRLAGVEPWAADASFNRARALLSLTYNLAIRADKANANPAQRVPPRKERNVRTGFITAAQYSMLAQECDSLWLRTMLALGFTYGWRAGELLGLHIAQVDLMARTLRLEAGTTKNARGRIIKLTAECFELVKACAAGKAPADYLLMHEDGIRLKNYRYRWQQLCARATLGRFVCRTCNAPGSPTVAAGRACPLCAKAKRRGTFRYQGLIFHDLRRSGVRGLVRAGISERVAMAISGHKTRAIFDRYNIVNEADLAEAVQRLERARQLAPELTPAPDAPEPLSSKIV